MFLNDIKEIEFTLGQQKIAALTNNNNDAPILLCLHGWLDNAASFLPLLPYLGDYHVIAIDWPGHGMSSHRSADAHYHFIDWVYDLVQLFDKQQWSNIDIVAHSMGGMVASAFAAAFPEHVKTLTLIDSIGFLTLASEKTTGQLRQGMLSRLSRGDSKNRFHPTLSSAVTARTMVSDLNKQCAELIVKRGIVQVEHGIKWRSDGRLRAVSPYRLTIEQAQQLISDVTVPSQLLYGDKGMEMVNLGLKTFAGLFDSLLTHELVGGHHVHMEQPKKTAQLITDFTKAH